MSSWSESLPRTVVMRGSDARAVRPARIGADLRSTPWVSTHGADPRLCDPTLEAVVAEAASTAADEARTAGFEDGLRAGLEQGREQARIELEAELAAVAAREEQERQVRAAQLASTLATLAQAATALAQREAPAVEELHRSGAVMGVEIAEALVGHHLEVAECPAREAVERALSLAPAGSVAVVRLHPDDVAAVVARGPLAADRSLTLVPDPQVERGGCVVDAGERRIDGQIGPALERVRAVLES